MNFLESSARLYFGARKAQLTFNGFRQHVLLGRWLRRRYVYGDGDNLFSEISKPNEVKVYSSPRQRTIFSATAHIMGIFPKSFPKIIFHGDSFKNDDTPPISNYHMNNLDGNEIKIEVIDYKQDFLFNPFSCKYEGSKVTLRKMIRSKPVFLLNEHQISNACSDILDKYSFILKNRRSFHNEKQYLDFQKNYEKKHFTKNFLKRLAGFIRPFKYHHINYEKLVPKNFNTVKKFILNKWYEIRITDSKELRTTVSDFFERIIKFFDEKIAKIASEKMIIFSGHDNNIVDILSNLMNPDALLKMIQRAPNNLEDYFFLVPRLASSLLFELHKEKKEYFINIVYNGKCYNTLEFREKVRVDPKNKKLFYEDFKSLLKTRIEKDYKSLICFNNEC